MQTKSVLRHEWDDRILFTVCVTPGNTQRIQDCRGSVSVMRPRELDQGKFRPGLGLIPGIHTSLSYRLVSGHLGQSEGGR